MMDIKEYNDLVNETAMINNTNAKKQAEILFKQSELLVMNESVFKKLDKWLELEISRLEAEKKEVPNE